jgi:hypothetical protein
MSDDSSHYRGRSRLCPFTLKALPIPGEIVMAITPPGAGASELVAFAIVDELIRTLVDLQILTPADTAAMIDRITTNVAKTNSATGDAAIPVLHEMFREYRTRYGEALRETSKQTDAKKHEKDLSRPEYKI